MKTPPEIVAEIKSIINQDLQERRACGYIYGSYFLLDRIAEAFGLNRHTVKAIDDRSRHRKVYANMGINKHLTIDAERVAKLRRKLLPKLLRDRRYQRAPKPRKTQTPLEERPSPTSGPSSGRRRRSMPPKSPSRDGRGG